MEQRYIGIKPLDIKGGNNLGMIFELDHGNGKYYCVNWPGKNIAPVCSPEQIQSDVDNGFLKPIDIDGKDI
jgi:hypothetical protein